MNANQRDQLTACADDYRAGLISRRDFITRTIAVLGGGALAATYLASMGLNRAEVASAQEAAPPPPQGQSNNPVTVSPTDPSIIAGPVQFPALDPAVGPLMGYMAQPNRSGIFPGVVIVHENQGLQPHFPDLARRFAKEGFAALAVDLLSRFGGTESANTPEALRDLNRMVTNPQAVADTMAAGAFLRQQPGVHRSSYGLIGFCMGGEIVWQTIPADPSVAAAGPFYGPNPPIDQLPKTRAAVLAVYAGLDTRVNASHAELFPALEAAGIRHEIAIYPDTNHAFFNDTKEDRYAPGAAMDAWARAITWFRTFLPAAQVGK